MNDMIDFTDVRLFYTKTGSAKYISHLDVMRAFQRAFKRSKIDFWYTEGFHPHLYLTFALPLSLGYESLAETVDFRLVSPMDYDEITERINKALPVGFKAIKASKPVMDAKEIKFAEYDISFATDYDRDKVISEWNSCFEQDSVMVVKRTKKGDSELDIKPHIKLNEIKFGEDDRYHFSAILASGVEFNINPELIFSAFRNFSDIEVTDISVLRTNVYNGKMKKFC